MGWANHMDKLLNSIKANLLLIVGISFLFVSLILECIPISVGIVDYVAANETITRYYGYFSLTVYDSGTVYPIIPTIATIVALILGIASLIVKSKILSFVAATILLVSIVCTIILINYAIVSEFTITILVLTTLSMIVFVISAFKKFKK